MAPTCCHLLNEYPLLSAVEVDVTESLWQRATTAAGEPHDHGFVGVARVRAGDRVADARRAGFAGGDVGALGPHRLEDDAVGLRGRLPRQVHAAPRHALLHGDGAGGALVVRAGQGKGKGEAAPDYARARDGAERDAPRLLRPASGGVYSPSLQATIYDAGCLVLKAAPRVASISIFTPNIHMIPMKQLSALGGPGQPGFQDDVYIATSEPSGTISCTVDRS